MWLLFWSEPDVEQWCLFQSLQGCERDVFLLYQHTEPMKPACGDDGIKYTLRLLGAMIKLRSEPQQAFPCLPFAILMRLNVASPFVRFNLHLDGQV